jgi:hypothetical protein
MNDIIDELQCKWKDEKKSRTIKPAEIDELMDKVNNKKREGLYFHYGNIFILTLVLIGIFLFFYFVAPVEETLSRIGAGLMLFGLVIRIVIEFLSVIKSKRIDAESSSLEYTNDTIAFYRFRKTIHGPITLTIIGLYTIGFYMISPEFSRYLSTWKMILIDVSYIPIAIILIIVIRNGIKKEMKTLSEIIEMRKEFQD